MKACFFARVAGKDILQTVNFYATDIQILRDLGYEVITATRFNEIPTDCDLYFIWWWTWAFMPLLKSIGKPTLITGVFDYIAYPLEKSYVNRPVWEKVLMSGALRGAKANVFVSHYEFDLIAKNFRNTNSHYVPLAVDTELYTPAEIEKEPFIFNVAWSGALNAQRKCLKQIIEALPAVLEKYPDVRLVMAGRQGEYHPLLVETAEKLGISKSVDFIGIISEEEKIRLMQRCAVYVQPTLFEGFGVAIAEAMACGAPVVTSPVGAIPEVVGNCGLMVNGEDEQTIADAIIRLLADTYLGADLGRRAREHIVQQFHYQRRKEALSRIIDDIS